LIEEPGDANQIGDVVAIQTVGRGGDNEVFAAFEDLMSAEDRWLRVVNFALGDELKVMTEGVEDAARRAVRHGNGHAAFAGDQADVADRRLAEIARVMPQVGAHAAACPVAEQAVLGPVVAWIKGAGALDDRFESAGAIGSPPLNAPMQLLADVGRNLEALVERAIVEVTNQGFLLLVAR